MNERYKVNSLVDDFLEFFRAREHAVVPSAPLLPEDPTLLFTAAGMVPFKAYYTDPARAPHARAASVQKCLRAGGKQSDLENVGRTLRHHTFFEMLGNFSFGDYFKKEAIEWGWELSVDVWGLDKGRIWVSVYEDDDEAFDLWAKHIGFPRERIVRLGKKDNFWGPVGETGVCGPSSEMHYDTGRPGPDGGPGHRDDNDRYIEYWNLVFPQFFYTEQGAYDPLPRPGIDTGLGLERVAFILQEAEDNYHTDEFLPVRNAVERALPAGASREKAALAVNAAADHARALVFAFAEGIMPSNEGRGYVLRRLLRRALTKLHPFGVRQPFLAGVVDAVVAGMKVRYPELASRGSVVKSMITAEEERFLSTLEQGMDRLDAMFAAAKKKKSKRIAGADVFQLYDTFGFPSELTAEMAADRGLSIDRAGFDRAMAKQKERARRASVFITEEIPPMTDEIGVEVTHRQIDRTRFEGYDRLEGKAEVVSYRDRKAPTPSDENRYFDFETDETVFYPEGGGQVGDTGVAVFGENEVRILDTRRRGGLISHVAAYRDPANPFKNRDVTLRVDRERRYATMRNHTATHLLHAALRRVLGDHVAQAGSLVAPDRLRFDFQHFTAVSPQEIVEIERAVNDAIMADLEVSAETVPYKEAVAGGAMALFGEKYGDTVRVVTVEDFSKELCGGTHLRRTGEIGAFYVRQESAVGSGLRRVEALTGTGALAYARRLVEERGALAEMLKVSSEDVERRVRTLLEEADALAKQVRKSEARRARDQAGDALAGAAEIGGLKLVTTTAEAADVAALRQYGDALRARLDLGVALICQAGAARPVCLIVASDRAIRERAIAADEIARRIAESLGHRGGGRPHMAQVGLPDVASFARVTEFVRKTLATLV
ncbi:MAG: alanine--tRNA ligase [Candidatus Krumholzibacteria bacterium]|nr:alanine--tRNA ligase [Candidatus Krumholzibacteria bacterium]